MGWIVAGEINSNAAKSRHVTCNSLQIGTCSESDQLTRFWDLEQVPIKKRLSQEEQACKKHFTETVSQDSTGRYIVKLPFNKSKPKIGDSHKMAFRRFHVLESKFAKYPDIKDSYSKFVQEYIQLNHMSEVQDSDHTETGFFLAHHVVKKNNSLTTKTRVVFDGSAKSSSGVSLNDTLMVGPTIQDNLFSIYTRFRSFPYTLRGLGTPVGTLS